MILYLPVARRSIHYVVTYGDAFIQPTRLRTFSSVMIRAYSNKRRNSEVYAQYVFVQQDGVLFFNIKEQGGKQQEVLFEE